MLRQRRELEDLSASGPLSHARTRRRLELIQPVVEALEGAGDGVAPYLRAASRRRDRESWQAEHVERFVEEAQLPTIELPDLGGEGLDEAGLGTLIEAFEAALESADA